MSSLNERLLERWIDLSLSIMNERIVSELPYNESLICNILSRQERNHPGSVLTATELCQMMQMQKSQMNRTLTHMEEKGLIARERSCTDKRQVFIRLSENPESIYQQQHEMILGIVDRVIEKMGEEKAEMLADIFSTLAETAEDVLK